MPELPQTAKPTDAQRITLAAIASGRLRVHEDEIWARWKWQQGSLLNDAAVKSAAERAEEAEGKDGGGSLLGRSRWAGWDRGDEDLPDQVRSVIELHDRDWVTREGKLTPLGLAVYLGWIREATGVDVAIDRVPVEVPEPVQVPID